MDLQRVRTTIASAFARDLRDGSVEIVDDQKAVAIDGGNWRLTVHPDGVASLDLPMNDANYYDDDTSVFLDNVFNLEVEQSLAIADRSLDGAIVSGLCNSGESWSEVFGGRIAAIGQKLDSAPVGQPLP